MKGCRVLVVEDEYLMAEDLRQELEAQGAEVLGPVPKVSDALDLLAQKGPPDAAVLDVNVAGEMVFPVADALAARGVPFVFTTGYSRRQLPGPYEHVPRCEKPINSNTLVEVLVALSR